MNDRRDRTKIKKRLKIILISLLLLPVILGGGFLVYASDYYRADETTNAILQSGQAQVRDDMIILRPEVASGSALIFYPGAKVEYTAYLPLLEKLRQNGITSVLMKMPFNMAIFSVNAADKAFDELSGIDHWFIGGHSMGGAMASSYAAGHQEKVKGLVLLGAYIYGDVAPKDALTVYGTLNADLEKHIDYTDNVVIIQGGNHAQFGNYGEQKGDPKALISREEQQDIAVQAILSFIREKTGE
ncbi:MAG: alpha/beta fold hydrolase [Clostridia bacterium]|nr:alpha/beta fold hydrolase [Clostridia bacterium]